MPNYGYDFGTLGVGEFSRGMQPGLDVWRRKRIQEDEDATKSAIEAGRLQLEAAKSGAWEGYQPEPEPGQGISSDTSINYPRGMTAQGLEAYGRGGSGRVQNLQGISDVEKRKQYMDEITKKETLLGQQVERRIKAVNASDTWFEKAFKDRDEGNSSPEIFMGQVQTAMDMSATGGRDLSKYNLDVSNFAKLSDLKASLKNADSTELANAYKGFLSSEKPEDKIESAVALGKVLSAYQQKYKTPAGSYKFMEDALEKFNTTKFAQPKEPTPPMYIEKPIDSTTQQKFRFNTQTGEHDLPFGKPYPIYKPEDVVGKAEEKKRLLDEKKGEKKELAKNALDKWFTDAVTKAGGELAPTPDGGFEIVGESFMGVKGSGAKGKDSKINSLKTIYDKSLKGIEKAYGAEKTEVKISLKQLATEKKQATEAIKARPDLAEKIKAMFKQETGQDYE